MYGKKVNLRFAFLGLILASVILTVFLVLQSLKENVVYFQSPSEIKSLIELNKKKNKSGWNG
jgi:cytochrome c-type biogenesis protein CcmE